MKWNLNLKKFKESRYFNFNFVMSWWMKKIRMKNYWKELIICGGCIESIWTFDIIILTLLFRSCAVNTDVINNSLSMTWIIIDIVKTFHKIISTLILYQIIKTLKITNYFGLKIELKIFGFENLKRWNVKRWRNFSLWVIIFVQSLMKSWNFCLNLVID